MIDIHCHILPGLDDGAKDLATAVEMARIAAADGIAEVVATPHAFDGEHETTPARAEAALAELRVALARAGIPLRLHLGSDCHLDERVLDPAHAGEVMTIAGGRYLLVEFPHELVPPRVEESLFRLRARGWDPILTHPERNRELQARGGVARIVEWIRAGLLVQVTGDSLTGGFGGCARAMSKELVCRGACHFVATDAHSPTWRRPVLSAARDAIAAIAGEAVARALVEENPGRAVRGEPIARGGPAVEPRPRKSRFVFWK